MKPSILKSGLLHAGFVATGIVTTLLGPLLPLLAAHWALDDKRAGLFFTAQFLGSLLGVFSTSMLLPRRGYSFVLTAGFAAMAAGVGALGIGPWTTGCLSVFVYGIGLGLTIPAANLYVSSISEKRPAAALSILNFAWSAGAVICPLIVTLLERSAGLRGLASLLAGVLALFALAFAVSPVTQASGEGASLRQPIAVWTSMLRRPQLISLALLFFLYVGTETALGGWIASHTKRASMATDSFWVFAPSVFWGTLLLGRALTPAVLRCLRDDKLVRIALAVATLGALFILVAASPAWIRIGAGLAGFGLAPIFPILVAWLRGTLGNDANWAGGMMFGFAGCGGAALPWFVGEVSASAGSLRTGLSVPLLSCMLMLLLAGAGRPAALLQANSKV